MAGRFLNTFLQDPNLSFVALNVVLSMLAVWLVFSLAREMFGVTSAFASLLLMATSPVFWFHGEVALSNAADCFFVCLLVLFCWSNLNNDHRRVYLSAVVLGLAGGIRQNTLLFMLPLWILSIRRAGLRKQLLSFAILVLTVTSWYLPMASLSGGMAAYQSALRDHWLNSNWHGFSLEWVPFNSFCVAYFILLGTDQTLSSAWSPFLFLRAVLCQACRAIPGFNSSGMASSAWLLCLHLPHPIQTGHSLIYLPALMILMPGCVQLSLQMKRLFRPEFEMHLVAGRATRQQAVSTCCQLWFPTSSSFGHFGGL
jgi:4-amino-4-deoxy-L-arabinose transferase-like glycosyltransferase